MGLFIKLNKLQKILVFIDSVQFFIKSTSDTKTIHLSHNFVDDDLKLTESQAFRDLHLIHLQTN